MMLKNETLLLILFFVSSCKPDIELAKKNINEFVKEYSDLPESYEVIEMESLKKVSQNEIEDFRYEKHSDTVNLNVIIYKVRHKYKIRALARDGYLAYIVVDEFYLDKKLNVVFV